MDRDFELELLARVREGDESAFDCLYAEFNVRLLGFLVRLSRRREVAEELVEETWLRFVRHAGGLEEGSSVGSWLFTVARNLFISHVRARATEASAVGELSLWPRRQPESPFEAASMNEFTRSLESALDEMPLEYREALLLVGVEGMRPSEAAVICGVKPDTMRQRVKRAREMLGARLAAADNRNRAVPRGAR